MHFIFDVMHWPRQVYLFDSKVSSEIPLAVGVFNPMSSLSRKFSLLCLVANSSSWFDREFAKICLREDYLCFLTPLFFGLYISYSETNNMLNSEMCSV